MLVSGMGNFRKSSYTKNEYWDGRHRFEHWYRDNSVYFITSKTREGVPMFDSERAKAIFTNRFEFYSQKHGFVPWVWSLLNNHYHMLGYLKSGENLGELMRQLHGSVAMMVIKATGVRHVPFCDRTRTKIISMVASEMCCRLGARTGTR